MPKKLPPKNSSWVQLTKDFVKEWPEILEGLHFKNMPVKYLLYCNINLKNHITIHYDIKKELHKRFLDKIQKEKKYNICLHLIRRDMISIYHNDFSKNLDLLSKRLV